MKASAKSGRAALNVGAAPQSDGLGDPIADWATCGTARWMIDASGCLRIEPADGAEGDLPLSGMLGAAPWCGDNDHIRSAVVKEGVRVVAEDGYTSASTGGMFYGCSRLSTLDLSGLDTSNVEDMYCMFYGCSKLESLDLSGLDTSNVEDMYCMFYGCSKLESLDLSGLGASKVENMSSMFCNCSKLKSLDLSGLDTSKVKYMFEMFEGCFALRTVVLGLAFSFRGYGSYLPTPRGESLTGKWLSSADGKAYASEAVPNNVAATYTMQAKADISGAVISDVPAKMTATGSQLAPKPVVTFNGDRLVEDKDYAVSYGENVEPGVGAGSVTVSAVEGGNFTGFVAVFFDIEKKITLPDVDYGNDWFAPAVTFVSSRGLITGYADSGEFGPLDTLTRGQLATILWRNACPDEAASYDASEAVNETGLSGVDDHEYYTAAANWAVREGIITGFEREDGTYDFAASSPVSFEQLITILSRLGATSDEVAAAGDDLSEFLDGDNASPWSRSPIAWAAEKGLVGGYENEDGTRTLAPGEDVSRGRAATVLMRAFDLGIMG